MKPIRNKQFAWIALVVILSLALPWAAFADNVVNNVEVGGNDRFPLGGYTDVNYRIVATGGDGIPGCNVGAANDGITATVTINVPPVVTATPAALVFDVCSTNQTVRFTATASGSYPVTVSVSGPGGWNVTPAAFTLIVEEAVVTDITPPTASPIQSPAANANGWNNDDVTITWNWADEVGGSGIDVDDCEMTSLATAEGEYDVTATCSDLEGNMGSASYGVKIDKTAPTANPTQAPPANANGWNNTNVTITWNWSDGSGSGLDNCTVSIVASAEGQYNVTDTCYDLAGNSYQASYAVKIDKTAPTANPSQAPPANANGWNNTNVTITWNWSDGSGSGLDNCTASTVASAEGQYNVTDTCYDLAGNSYQASYAVEIDKTDPTVSAAVTPAAASTGWWNIATGAPTVTFTCDDLLSGIFSCTDPYTFPEGAGQSYTGTAVDNADNSASATVEDIDVDLTAPTLAWNGGPAAGGSYYFGSVPAAPTCTAYDALSGPAGCTVTGYGTTVGSHTLTATAYDVAGNMTVETRTYTVLAWTLTGFYQPVNMDALNTVKGGSTVPLKFNAYAGDTELTDVALVSFSAAPYTCGGSLPEDPVTMTTTGNTSLRYDFTDGQFIQNWKTPKQPGKCYLVTMTTSDGSKLEANFKLK